MQREEDPASGVLRRLIGRDRSLSRYGGDGVLEHQLVSAVDVDDDGEPVEVLDTSVELASIHQMDQAGMPGPQRGRLETVGRFQNALPIALRDGVQFVR